MAPQFLGGNMVLDLDNLATLTAWPPPTRERVTLMLHFIAVPPAMECVSVTKEGCENLRNSNVFKVVTSHGPIYSFDTNHPRHEIPVAGRTFVVTLKEINNVDIAGLSHPFEVVFGISEK